LPATPFLYTGVITADFQSDGTTDAENNCENIRASGAAKQCLKRLNNKDGRPSGPLDKLHLS